MRHTTERAEQFIKTVRFQRHYPLSTGYEAIARQMQAYPTFTPQETDIAVRAFRNGFTLVQLAQKAPFQEKLAVEEANRVLQRDSFPRPSYQLLFTEKRNDGQPITIPEVIAISHHDLVLKWISSYEQMFRDLALPLDDFYNKALSDLLPREVETYNPDVVPGSFRSWASRMLFWRLHTLAQKRARELRSLPAEMKQGNTIAFKDINRVAIISIDAPLPGQRGEEHALSLAETLESPQREYDNLENSEAIAHLFTLAGLTPQEKDAVAHVVLAEETSRQVGENMRRSDRMIRNYRKSALAKLLQVGNEQTIRAILQGDQDGGEHTEQARTEKPVKKRKAGEKEERTEPLKELCCPNCATLFLPKKTKGKAQKYCQSTCRIQAKWKKDAEKRKEQRHEARSLRRAAGAIRETF